jgi:hypothetical protein
MPRAILFVALLTLLAPLRAFAVEEAHYTLVHHYADFDVRQYAPYWVAQTTVEARFSDAGDEGFRRLFAYISGANSTRGSIAMTAPVIQSGEKIAMTAPVLQQQAAGAYSVQFVMPAGSTAQSLPTPTDTHVTIREMPAERYAVLQYSGFWTEQNYADHLTLLQKALHREGLTAIGAPVWARYDPPFMPWFLRRNEILVPVAMQ